MRDEISGLLRALEADSKRGRGTGVPQLLALFDGAVAISSRVGVDAWQFERCHVSLFGNIQQAHLRQLINGDDCTGKFARFLFCELQATIPRLNEHDSTAAEQQQYLEAQQVVYSISEQL